MPHPSLHHHPSLESSSPLDRPGVERTSLFDTKDDFIERVAPIAIAAIYFGSFSLPPIDAALSRQALFKLSFVYRHFLDNAGLKIDVQSRTATLSGRIPNRLIALFAEILATQIKGIEHIRDQTEKQDAASAPLRLHKARLLLATDQTLRSGVQVSGTDLTLTLEGQVTTAKQKHWAEHLLAATGGSVISHLKVEPGATAEAKPADVDDESLEALVLLRLRLVHDTEHLPLRVKASRGVVTLLGKVRTEAVRQRAENVSRATLGLRELRSNLHLLD